LGKAAVEGRTGQSGAPAMSPNRWGSTVGASDNWATGQSSGAPDSHCSLSGAPSGACSDSMRAVAHCSLLLLQTTVGAIVVASHGTPDSPVNYSGVASQIPEGGKSGVPDQRSLRLSFALFI
jgi:hypothetical protein